MFGEVSAAPVAIGDETASTGPVGAEEADAGAITGRRRAALCAVAPWGTGSVADVEERLVVRGRPAACEVPAVDPAEPLPAGGADRTAGCC